MEIKSILGLPSLGRAISAAVVSGLLLGAALTMPQPAKAGTLDANVIGMFPKDVGEFGYADMKKARTLKWFPQLQEQVLPERFRQFEKFLASTGNDPNSQVDEIAWALVAEGMTAKAEGTGSDAVPTGEQMVGVALGNFNQDSTASYFKKQKLPTSNFHGYTLYAFGTGTGATDLFFVFIDASTAAYGHRSILEKMISVRFGDEEGLMRNDKFFALINEANTRQFRLARHQSCLYSPRDPATCAGDSAVPGSGEAGDAHAKLDHQCRGGQRSRRKGPGHLRFNR